MQAGCAIIKLEEHQRRVAGILADVRPLLGTADALHLKALALARWQLLRVLREYQLFKHGEIFDPIIRVGPSGKADTATLLKRQCVETAAAFNSHVQRWSLAGPATAWPTYSAEALAMAERIDQHLATELRDVRALLTGLERTRKP